MIDVVLLGPPEIRRADGTVAPACNGSIELMAFLASRPGRCETRDRIAEALWPEGAPERQRARLSTAIWRLKRDLKAAGIQPASALCTAPTQVSLHPAAPIRLDVEELRAAYRTLRQRRGEPLPPEDFAQLSAATLLWRGGYLPGHDGEWALVEQGGLVTAYQSILDRLLVHHARHGQWRRSIDCARALLELDPLLEHAYRAAIEAHGALGERSRAQQVFDRCRYLLEAELGVPPLPETVEAYEAALFCGRHARHSSDRRTEALTRALSDLRSATKHLEKLARLR